MLRRPHQALRPFIREVWIADHARPTARPRFREQALPDGHMHLVIRLSDQPIRILDTRYPIGRSYGFGVIGGARASFYTREIEGPNRAIGATLLPGAAQALFGASALEFADRHTALEELWGARLSLLREQLLHAGEPELQLEIFEMSLLACLPQVRGIHPAIAQTLADIHAFEDVGAMVARSGFSHRRFIELFGHAVGLTPKRFVRVQRFRRALGKLTRTPNLAWADLAADAGYSDQAHFNREFREFAGLTPEDYRRAAPPSPGHVLLPEAEPKERK